MKRAVAAAAVVAALSPSVAADASTPAQRTAARAGAKAVVVAYLHAIARGDASGACRLLSPAGIEDAGYSSLRACTADYKHVPRGLGRVPIVRVVLRSLTEGDVIVGDAAYSDSGNDAVGGRRYRRVGWRIDAG